MNANYSKNMNYFFQRIYFWMFLGLMLSAIASLTVFFSPTFFRLIFGTPLFFILILAELGLVVTISGFIKRISENTARVLFIIYSLLTGLTLSVILFAYTSASVFFTLVIVASMFALLSIYGFFTKRDLSRLGVILFIALITLIISMIINLFLRNSYVDMIISFIGVIIFTGLIVYDTQAMKKFYILGKRNKKLLSKFVIIGALKLYLDFVNLFLFLLRFLGKRKE